MNNHKHNLINFFRRMLLPEISWPEVNDEKYLVEEIIKSIVVVEPVEPEDSLVSVKSFHKLGFPTIYRMIRSDSPKGIRIYPEEIIDTIDDYYPECDRVKIACGIFAIMIIDDISMAALYFEKNIFMKIIIKSISLLADMGEIQTTRRY